MGVSNSTDHVALFRAFRDVVLTKDPAAWDANDIGTIALLRDKNNNMVSWEINQIDHVIKLLRTCSKSNGNHNRGILMEGLEQCLVFGFQMMRFISRFSLFEMKYVKDKFKAITDRMKSYGLQDDDAPDEPEDSDNNVTIEQQYNDSVYEYKPITKAEIDSWIMTMSWERELLMIVQDCISTSDDPAEWKNIYYNTPQRHMNGETYNKCRYLLKDRAIMHASDLGKLMLDPGAVSLWLRDAI
jgi:hypothetical protein